MKKVPLLASSISVLALSACGTSVPPLKDGYGSQAATVAWVQNIVHAVHCEMFDAVRKLYVGTTASITRPEFMKNWGAQMLLTLQVDETGSLSPNALFTAPTPAASFFSLSLGGSVSSHAARLEKVNFFYSMDQLRKAVLNGMTCPLPPRQPGAPLIRSDLGLYEWLLAEEVNVGVGEFEAAATPDTYMKQNVLFHEIKFDITTSASVNPLWKLTNIAFNTSGNLASVSRERLHDLQITMGPIDHATISGLIPAAENVSLASQINSRLGLLSVP